MPKTGETNLRSIDRSRGDFSGWRSGKSQWGPGQVGVEPLACTRERCATGKPALAGAFPVTTYDQSSGLTDANAVLGGRCDRRGLTLCAGIVLHGGSPYGWDREVQDGHGERAPVREG